MVMGPIANCIAVPSAPDGCDRFDAAGMMMMADSDCSHCPTSSDDGGSDRGHGASTRPAHGQCGCACGQTPALAVPGLNLIKPVSPEILAGEPKGPSFEPPYYDF